MANDVMITVSADGAVDPAQDERAKKISTLLSKAQRQFRTVCDSESMLRDKQLDDKKFRASFQWDDNAIVDRQVDNRPYLTINRLDQFVRVVTNGLRQANLSIKVLPVDDASDIPTAEVFQGIIRHIEDQSDASVAYATAADDQVTIGRGWWQITAEYLDERSFVQDLRIRRIRNAFSVYMDPSSQEPDGSDARYIFVVQDIPKDEYIQRYGEASYASLTTYTSTGNQMTADWMPEGMVRVAEYWYVEVEEKRIHLVEFEKGEQDVLTDEEMAMLESLSPEVKPEVKVLASRPVQERRVKMAIINAITILEGNDDKTEGKLWPGQWIPIIPVIGEEIDINGQVDLRGMVRDAKDAQRMYNFQNTALAETLAQAPMTQWVGYFGQFEGHEKKWNQINRRRFPYVEVNPTTADGKVVPLPQRITAEPPIQAIVQAIRQADNDLKATMGLYDPSLGQRGPQQSGKAITALQEQGDLANSNFLDNLSRSIRATGRQLVNLIPHYYDAPRVIRIIGVDDELTSVMVHTNQGDKVPKAVPDGVQGIYDLGAGRYDVVISQGPSDPTKRKEAVEALSTFVNAYPDSFPVLGDIIMKNMDWPGAQAAAARMKKMLPPQLQDNPTGQPGPEQVALLQQQLEQAMAALQEAQQQLQSRKLETESNERVKAAEITSRERIAALNAEMELMTTKAKAELDLTIERMKLIAEERQQQADRSHDVGMARIEHTADHASKAFDAARQDKADHEGRSHEVGTQARDHAHDRVKTQVTAAQKDKGAKKS